MDEAERDPDQDAVDAFTARVAPGYQRHKAAVEAWERRVGDRNPDRLTRAERRERDRLKRLLAEDVRKLDAHEETLRARLAEETAGEEGAGR